MVVVTAIFLALFAALGMTASGRATTERSARYAGLYDLAVSGNEKAFLVIREALEGAGGEVSADDVIRGFLGTVGTYEIRIGDGDIYNVTTVLEIRAAGGYTARSTASGTSRGVTTREVVVTAVVTLTAESELKMTAMRRV
jgi:hypothetical protein